MKKLIKAGLCLAMLAALFMPAFAQQENDYDTFPPCVKAYLRYYIGGYHAEEAALHYDITLGRWVPAVNKTPGHWLYVAQRAWWDEGLSPKSEIQEVNALLPKFLTIRVYKGKLQKQVLSLIAGVSQCNDKKICYVEGSGIGFVVQEAVKNNTDYTVVVAGRHAATEGYKLTQLKQSPMQSNGFMPPLGNCGFGNKTLEEAVLQEKDSRDPLEILDSVL